MKKPHIHGIGRSLVRERVVHDGEVERREIAVSVMVQNTLNITKNEEGGATTQNSCISNIM